ncbi:MAG TPA: type II toxin-antitoxin system Phd/YefM family antitoxin [Burkholderiales bacterium]|nr:type II toxin-antitoxin system Phd/YefM family antitoxin [Burkholderiales bacterium]
MGTVNIHEAKTQLSRLIERVKAGEVVVIAKAGKPVARLVPATPAGLARKPGALKGRIRVGRDFNAPLPEEMVELFAGRAPSR